MAFPVYLQDVVDEMDVQTDRARALINQITGELYTLTEDDLEWLEAEDDPAWPAWQKEAVVKAREVDGSEDWLLLPSKFEIHEYAIMEAFCWALDDEDMQQELLSAIRGGGAFRRFKDAIHRFEIQDDWYQYRNEALEKIAIEWLDAHQITYKRGRRPLPTE
jgi:hypothetical protein